MAAQRDTALEAMIEEAAVDAYDLGERDGGTAAFRQRLAELRP
jgi:hypothetical protein